MRAFSVWKLACNIFYFYFLNQNLTLFGIDLIVEKGTGHHLVVDINYFPGKRHFCILNARKLSCSNGYICHFLDYIKLLLFVNANVIRLV